MSAATHCREVTFWANDYKSSLHQSATDVSDSPVTDARAMDLSLQLAVCPVCRDATNPSDCCGYVEDSVVRLG